MRKVILALCVYWFATAHVATAQTLNQEMEGLAAKLSKALLAQGFKSVAAVDFTDLQGQSTELGRFLSERLVVEIVSSGGVSMLDRANIKSILAEHKLTEEGLVNPANAKKLGEFAGVDAILIGNATPLDSGIELLVKAVATESSKLVAAGRITFPKTSEIQQLLNRGISSHATASKTAATGSSASYQDASAIAVKDVGSLRVVLKSMSPMRLTDTPRRSRNGIRCVFEFISLETQRPVVVALNATADDRGLKMGQDLRSSLIDENGGLWALPSPNVTGISTIGVGSLPGGGSRGAYDPAQILTLLSKRDDLGSDVARGTHRFYGDWATQFIFGSMTEMSPGQSMTVTMNFVQDTSGGASSQPPKAFQISIEVATGLPTKASKRSYSLHNVVFDRVGVPSVNP